MDAAAHVQTTIERCNALFYANVDNAHSPIVSITLTDAGMFEVKSPSDG